MLGYIGKKTHTLRYVFRNRKTDDVFFVVEFKLLYGDDVDAARAADLPANAPLQHHVDTDTDGVD